MQHPGLLRILAAIFYDLWLVLALILLGATADTFIRHLVGADAENPSYLWLQIYFVIAPLLFFAWFWTHGGQTLGMRSWKMRVVTPEGKAINNKQAVIRYFAAILSWLLGGLGYLWVWFDANKQSLHDKLSGTCLVRTE
jgi:uncharacterized RDD family membrane protein YckC